MTVKIEFMGYVNAVRTYDWGVAYDVSHNQLQKKGELWEVTGRDYFSVVAPEGAPMFAENDQVVVKGTLKTKAFLKKDGTKGIALNVRAESMEKNATITKAAPPVQDIWPGVQEIPQSLDEAPF